MDLSVPFPIATALVKVLDSFDVMHLYESHNLACSLRNTTKPGQTRIALLPTSLEALRTRVRIHLRSDNFDAALADFGSCIEQAESERADADVRSLRVELKKAEATLEHSKTKDCCKILRRSLLNI